MRLLVVAEDLSPPPDEGMKKTAWSLIRAWAAGHEVSALTRTQPTEGLDVVRQVPIDKFFQNNGFCSAVSESHPEASVYFPEASATRNSFWRARRLKLLTRRPVVMMALQPRSYGLFDRYLIRRWAPDLVVVQSTHFARRLRELCPRVAEIPVGVDLERFRPAAPEERSRLRERFGFPADRPAVLHVGHIKANRNLGDLAQLARDGRFQVALLGSTSTERDEAVKERLEATGVRVFAEFVADVETVYRAADAYVFPVVAPDAAMDLPLSVLEATATDLPVATRRFGGLPDRFPECESFRYYGGAEELPAAVAGALAGGRGNRERVKELGWGNVAQRVLEAIKS